MESIITDFHVDWRLLLAQVFNFSVVVAVLYFFAFKPTVKMMTERTNRIEKGLRDADESRNRLEQAEKETRAILKEARTQADLVVADADRRASENRAVSLEKTREEVKIIIDTEKAKLVLEREQTMAELKKESAALAVSLAEKILGEKMDVPADDIFIKTLTK